MLTSKAIAIALEEGTDLVEVAPGADPPVCRLMDYGKFLYEAQKREKDARKTQTKVEIKEIRLRPKTGDHDISYKLQILNINSGTQFRVTIRTDMLSICAMRVCYALMVCRRAIFYKPSAFAAGVSQDGVYILR